MKVCFVYISLSGNTESFVRRLSDYLWEQYPDLVIEKIHVKDLVKEGKPFFMYPCFGIIDNVLLAICQPDELSQYMDRNLMSPQEIHKMETLKEDDNPVILKYYLK